jgi:hypothetical protein
MKFFENDATVCYLIQNVFSDPDVETKTYMKDNRYYRILKQRKTPNISKPTYRSIVFSLPENELLCFSPPKAICYKVFKSIYKESNDKMFVNEKIEGVMINLFYDFRISKWEIATKFSIGGNYNFYGDRKKNPTFREMFLETFRCDKDVKDIIAFESFPKHFCYSFVMQHPKNKMTLRANEAKLYLVGVYNIRKNNTVSYVPQNEYEEWDTFRGFCGIIDFPKKYEFEDFEKLENEFLSIHNEPITMGIMIHNMNTGERTHLMNPSYTKFKTGMNPMDLYKCLCIHKMDKQTEFLTIFPSFSYSIICFQTEYYQFINDIYVFYIENYVEKQHKRISNKYLPHIQNIHKTIYIPSLKKEKIIITKQRVREYFDQMDPRELLFHLTYDNRTFS